MSSNPVMSSFIPRAPYSPEELNTLYPSGLQLQQVQVILRHGERSPVTARFRNAGLPAYWPYCNAAKQMRSVLMTSFDSAGNGLESGRDVLAWRRRLEIFGADNGPTLAAGSRDEVDGICNMGELTDQGRATTHALGERLRHLYVDQLGFMPRMLQDADSIYLRATPIPRALESVQQAFVGMYPKTARTQDFPPPTIVLRSAADETLFPNEGQCKRFGQLFRAFAQRTADRHNASPDMDYLNSLIGKWMPETSPRVAVDSHPRLSGIMDTVNATLAHPEPTRLPKEFYDTRAREILSRTNVEEWFGGYKESQEFRTVGIGALAGDIVERMVGSAESNAQRDGLAQIGDRSDVRDPTTLSGRGGEKAVRFCMSGAHDTTLAALLTALGAFEGEHWPPFTSHVAIELFKRAPSTPSSSSSSTSASSSSQSSPTRSLWNRVRGSSGGSGSGSGSGADGAIARRPLDELDASERSRLDGYFVRLRYNDRILRVPGCAPAGRHLEGDDGFCTLEAFKRVVDGFTPRNWRDACGSNLDKSPFPEKAQPAGW